MLHQLSAPKHAPTVTTVAQGSIYGHLMSILFVTLDGGGDQVRHRLCRGAETFLIRRVETPGEDPFHVASYALAFTSGMEGPTDSPFKKIIATCKHAAAYDVDSWEGIDRYHFDANVSIQELAEYYMPPFEACARDAKVGSLMCSYNEINGVPTCADPWLLQALIREHWGWDDPAYYVTSDCFALDQIFVSHNYTDTAAEAAAIALQAGTDTDCGIFYSTYLPDALNQGLISEADIDRSLTRVFTSIVNLGYFDPPENQPYRSIGWSSVNTIQSQALAYKAATAGITLLKNDQDALPLQVPGDGRKLSVALFGDWANATVQMQGNYYGPAPYLHSPLYGLQRIPNVLVKFFPELNISASALAAANASDIIIYIGGIDQTVEAESLDRTTIEWNATQVSLIASLASLNRPFILVQTGGGQLDDTQFLADPGVSAILWAGYPGQDGGSAIADVMFGQVAPAGRLSVTQYPANYVSVPMTDMNLRPDAEGNLGRTYKWYTGTPVLPFGFGLHYTQFTAELNLSGMLSWNTSELVGKCASVTPIDACVVGTLVIQVTNSGQRQSDYSVLAFVNGSYGPLPRPNKELVAYTRVRDLNPSEQREVQLSITLARLARWDETGCRVLYPGEYRIAIDTDPELTTASFNLVGEPQVLESWPTPTGSRQWKRSVKL